MSAIRLVLVCAAASALALPAATQDADTARARGSTTSPNDAAWRPHRKLRVLYAGKEGGQRERVFGAFLKEWFDKSKTIPLAKLSMRSAKDYDVVIVDWMSQYGCDGYPERGSGLHAVPIKLDESFSKPFIAMTYVGSRVRSGYKLNWL